MKKLLALISGVAWVIIFANSSFGNLIPTGSASCADCAEAMQGALYPAGNFIGFANDGEGCSDIFDSLFGDGGGDAAQGVHQV